MSPQSASRGPVEQGFVHVPRLWERRCPERTADGSRHKNWDVCLIFGIPSWLMPLRDRSGQSSQPAGHKVTTAVKVSLRFIGTCQRLRCTYIVHTLTRQVFLGCCNEVWFHRFPSPPFGSPFTLSPPPTSFPLSFHVFPCFMSFHLTPFVLLRVQQSGP